MDDITPDMNWGKFLRFKNLCDQYQIAPLIGIVPDCKDPNLHIDAPKEDFWTVMQELQSKGWVIAQHGNDHVYKTKKMGMFPLNQYSAYAGVSYEEQLRDLQHGKKILQSHGIETDIFMAPAHSFDQNTLQALKETGFTRITDGFGYMPYQWKSFTFYPISFRQSKSLSTKKQGYTTIVIHANTMDEADFERYERILKQKHNDFISYSELLSVKPVKRNYFGRMIEFCKAYFKFILVQKL